MLTQEVNDLKKFGYHPSSFITADEELEQVLALLEKGWNGESFHEIVDNLRTSDPYMVMADFRDYRRAQQDLSELYKKRETWNKMSLANIANSGVFSADRSVFDYARDIWRTVPVK
ncbi:MAG: glycogen/starch/alpha-glucan phosphorylase, partial [Oscillospiraceae bacterium]